MDKYLNSALIPIAVGLLTGTVIGVVLFETTPAILGWIFGAGMGLMGGALLAAIASGDAVVGGPKPRRRNDAPWLDPAEDDEDR